MHHRRIFALAFTALAFSPAASFAASATQSGYDDDSDVVVQDDTDSGSKPQSDSGDKPTTSNSTANNAPASAAPSASSSTGSLPFTGMEAGLIAAAGLGLAGTGYALRRAAREE